MNTARSQRALRVVDLLLIAIAAPLWIPVFAIIALAVLFSSGSPILFHQERVGRNGDTFSMRKFRSMRNGDNPLIPDPDRITRIGAILRRTSLDELPQLLNVIDGSMSLVGPRPMLPAQLSALSPAQFDRHLVRPGLTGLAQVSGRNTLTWDERFVHDVEWAENPTVRRYVSILARTASTVIAGDGVDGHAIDDRVLVETEHAVLDLDEISLDGISRGTPTPRTSARLSGSADRR